MGAPYRFRPGLRQLVVELHRLTLCRGDAIVRALIDAGYEASCLPERTQSDAIVKGLELVRPDRGAEDDSCVFHLVDLRRQKVLIRRVAMCWEPQSQALQVRVQRSALGVVPDLDFMSRFVSDKMHQMARLTSGRVKRAIILDTADRSFSPTDQFIYLESQVVEQLEEHNEHAVIERERSRRACKSIEISDVLSEPTEQAALIYLANNWNCPKIPLWGSPWERRTPTIGPRSPTPALFLSQKSGLAPSKVTDSLRLRARSGDPFEWHPG